MKAVGGLIFFFRRWEQVGDCSLCRKKTFWLQELFFSLRVRQFLFQERKSNTEWFPKLFNPACFLFRASLHLARTQRGHSVSAGASEREQSCNTTWPSSKGLKAFLCSGGRLPGRQPKLYSPIPHQLGALCQQSAILTVKAGASRGQFHSFRSIQRSTRSEIRIVLPIYVSWAGIRAAGWIRHGTNSFDFYRKNTVFHSLKYSKASLEHHLDESVRTFFRGRQRLEVPLLMRL